MPRYFYIATIFDYGIVENQICFKPNFIAFNKYGQLGVDGQVISIFVIILAAAEAVIALAIILNIYNNFKTVNADEIDNLKE